MSDVQVLEEKELFRVLAAEFISEAKKAIAARDRFAVALSGGTTPVALYEKLVGGELTKSLDLSKIYFFFGDERDVSPESERSNYRLARDLLFRPLGVPAANVIRWPTEIIDAEEVAAKYGQAISRFFKLGEGELPRFDLVLLGLGEDCHTASLFPNTAALNEKSSIAVSNRVEKLDTNRLTLTYPAINNARRIIFTVTGSAKAEAVREVLAGEKNCTRFPAQCIEPVDGKLLWLVDKKAGALLN